MRQRATVRPHGWWSPHPALPPLCVGCVSSLSVGGETCPPKVWHHAAPSAAPACTRLGRTYGRVGAPVTRSTHAARGWLSGWGGRLMLGAISCEGAGGAARGVVVSCIRVGVCTWNHPSLQRLHTRTADELGFVAWGRTGEEATLRCSRHPGRCDEHAPLCGGNAAVSAGNTGTASPRDRAARTRRPPSHACEQEGEHAADGGGCGDAWSACAAGGGGGEAGRACEGCGGVPRRATLSMGLGASSGADGGDPEPRGVGAAWLCGYAAGVHGLVQRA